MLDNSNFFAFLEDKIDTYRTRAFIIKEANEMEDDTENEKPEGDEMSEDTQKANDVINAENEDSMPDPTTQPEGEDSTGLPANDNGVKISDSSFVMYANLLLKAFLATPSQEDIKELDKDRVVDESNADQVIKDIENLMTKRERQQSTQNAVVNNLTKY